jgi:transposase
MACIGCPAAAGEGAAWPAAGGSPGDGERHLVAASHRRALARRARALWQLEQHLALLPALVPERHLGSGGGNPRRDDGGPSTSQHRFHDGSGPCLGRRRKRGTREQAFGRSRGGFTCKVHCIVEARGRPLGFHLTGGEKADCKSYDTLIDLPEQRPDAMLADKGYDTDAIRADLKARGIRAVIPPRSHRTAAIRWNKRLYRLRNRIERVIGHLKINRAIATRYDKLADSFLGMLHLAAFRYWCKFVHWA